MGVKKKDVLLETLGSLTDAVMRLTGLVVKTAPLGIFALAAAAAGTLDWRNSSLFRSTSGVISR